MTTKFHTQLVVHRINTTHYVHTTLLRYTVMSTITTTTTHYILLLLHSTSSTYYHHGCHYLYNSVTRYTRLNHT